MILWNRNRKKLLEMILSNRNRKKSLEMIYNGSVIKDVNYLQII